MDPNPISTMSTDSELTSESTNNVIDNKQINFTIKIYNSQSMLLSTFTRSGSIFSIPLTNLRDGVYVIEVSDGINNSRQQFIVKNN